MGEKGGKRDGGECPYLVWFGRKGGEGREMEKFPFSLDALSFFLLKLEAK